MAEEPFSYPFVNSFVFDSYACRKRKSTHATVDRASRSPVATDTS
ncbi:MAG: hypothetical protein ACHRXM_07015 [Isosphaerales bacterium]